MIYVQIYHMSKKSSKNTEDELELCFEHVRFLSFGLTDLADLQLHHLKYDVSKEQMNQTIDTRSNSIKILYNELLLRWSLIKQGLNKSLSGKQIKEKDIKQILSKLLNNSQQFSIISEEIHYLDTLFIKKSKDVWVPFGKVIKDIQQKTKNKTIKKLKLVGTVEATLVMVDCLLAVQHEYKLAIKMWDVASKAIHKEWLLLLNFNRAIETDISWKISDLSQELDNLEHHIYNELFGEGIRGLDISGRHKAEIKLDKNQKKIVENYLKLST